jgi:hypothetical protein
VEQVVDAAIERIAREQNGREPTLREPKGSTDVARRTSNGGKLARRNAQALAVPTRLRWKGLDVSDEFRQYAERVARGEDLPPFEGRVLAEPSAAFPWGQGVLGEEAPKKRGSGTWVWGAAFAVLGMLGGAVALRLEGAATNVPVATSIAPLAPPTSTAEPAQTADTPPDVVETPTRTTPVPSSSGERIIAQVPASPIVPSAPEPSAAAASLRGEPAATVAIAAAPTSPPSTVAATPAASGPSVAVNLARPGALQQAVGAALAGRSPAGPAAAPTENKPGAVDEFGIMASVSPAPVAATPAPAPAPAGAKSNGNVGDLSLAGTPSASSVRKEPGTESSAKGSLLVETPSF